LGRRIRARRLHLGHTRETVARGAEISVTQLVLYESGQGHPPAATLHRIARTLGTSTSALLGETMAENAEQVDEMMQIYAHPVVGAVLRYMQEMSKQDLRSLQVIASAFAGRHKQA
jgi:transcriptional regulator with XRE-family HTH domain